MEGYVFCGVRTIKGALTIKLIESLSTEQYVLFYERSVAILLIPTLLSENSSKMH